MYHPVANLMAGLDALDKSIGLDGILIGTVNEEVYTNLPRMVERWPTIWRFSLNPLELTFDPGLTDHVPHFLWALGEVDAVVTCTKFVEENLKQLNCPNTCVIPPCLDTKECKLAEPTTDLVVTLTRIAPIKNILSSLLAMSRVCREMPSVEYNIFGGGPQAPYVEQWVKGVGTEQISYKGFVPADKVLSHARVFLQTSISENFSLSVLEAMAHGVPVVCSEIPGHAMGNVYFENIGQIASEVKLLLTDDDIWKEWREVGLEKVKEFDVREVVPQWEKLFKRLTRLKEFKKECARVKEARK